MSPRPIIKLRPQAPRHRRHSALLVLCGLLAGLILAPLALRAITCASFSPNISACIPPSGLDPWYTEYVALIGTMDTLFSPTLGAGGHDHDGTPGRGPLVRVVPHTAVDCTSTYITAILYEHCVDLLTDEESYCFDTAGPGADPTVCDHPSEWHTVSSGGINNLQEAIDACESGGACTVTLPVGSGGVGGLRLVTGTATAGLQICETASCANKWTVYASTGADPQIDTTGTGPIIWNAPTGQGHQFQFNGATGITFGAGGLIQYTSSWRPRSPMVWQPGALSPDGTGCTRQTEALITGYGIVCSTTSGSMTGRIQTRDAFDPSVSLSADLRIKTVGTAAQNFVLNLECVCAGLNDAVPLAADFTAAPDNATTIAMGTTAGILKGATITGVTCGGTCQSGDDIFFRLSNTASHTALDDIFLETALNFTLDQQGED
jgi:hypothetical protein